MSKLTPDERAVKNANLLKHYSAQIARLTPLVFDELKALRKLRKAVEHFFNADTKAGFGGDEDDATLESARNDAIAELFTALDAARGES